MNNSSTRLPLLPPCNLHCLCVQSESERVFGSQVKETHRQFSRWISSTLQTTTNDSLASVLKILCFKKLYQTGTSMLVKLAVSIHRTGVTDSSGDWDEDDRDRNGWSQQTLPFDDQFTIRTGVNTDLDVVDASQFDFFYQLFTPEMFATIAEQRNEHAWVKMAAIPSLPCSK